MLWHLVLLLACCAAGDADWEPDGNVPQLALELRSSKPEYVLGEPVVLCGILRNRQKVPIRLWPAHVLPPQRGGLELMVSREDGPFTPCWISQRCPVIVSDWLRPEFPWRFHIRVLHAPSSPSGLACEGAGRYRVKLLYPVVNPSRQVRGKSGVPDDEGRVTLGQGSQRRKVESNVVCFAVRAPEGRDAEVWRALQRREFLYFLQFGRTKAGHEETVRRLIEIASRTPESSYHPAIRWALRTHYVQCKQEREAICKVLRFPGRAVYAIGEDHFYPLPAEEKLVSLSERLFPEDRRLDQMLVINPTEFRWLSSTLDEVTQGYGVRLGMSLAVVAQYQLVCEVPIRQTLRQFMASVQVPGTKWVKDGEGYMLVPAPEEAGKP